MDKYLTDENPSKLQTSRFYKILGEEDYYKYCSECTDLVEGRKGFKPPNKHKALYKELMQIQEDDQRHRKEMGRISAEFGEKSPEMDSIWALQRPLDQQNQRKVERILEVQGHPTKEMVGEDMVETCWFVIQHSTLEKMEYYLPLFLEMVNRGDLGNDLIVMLIDRIHGSLYGGQLYGSQHGVPIYNEEELEKRREWLSEGKLTFGKITFGDYEIVPVGESVNIRYK